MILPIVSFGSGLTWDFPKMPKQKMSGLALKTILCPWVKHDLKKRDITT